jgi:hypothetical protein
MNPEMNQDVVMPEPQKMKIEEEAKVEQPQPPMNPEINQDVVMPEVKEKKKRVYKKKEKVVEPQKMKIEEEVKVEQPQPLPMSVEEQMREIEEDVEEKQLNDDFLHVEEQKMKSEEDVKIDEPQPQPMSQPEEQPQVEEQQAGEEMVKIYRVFVDDKKAKFLSVKRFRSVVDRLIDEGTSFKVVIDEVSKSSQVYNTLQLQESAKEQEQKSKKEPKAQKEKREQSAPKEKRELSDGLQVRHVWKGHTWLAKMGGGIIGGVENFKTFSEFARKHKLVLGQDTTANGVAECEWFNERTQKWVKGMYAETVE